MIRARPSPAQVAPPPAPRTARPPMIVLGLETSCDETGVAVYDTARGLRAHALYSQVGLHAEYGGVVPELASRDHVRKLLPLLRQTLAEAGLAPGDLGGVAYTAGPGLIGALLVGAATGRALAWALDLPSLGVHHMEGHLLSPLLEPGAAPPPFVCLLVSGGHTQLVAVEGVGRYRLLGESLDDAAGEAFDKTAKLLGRGYPGGPALARLAEHGDAAAYALPRPLLHSGDLDFSFAGLKTAVATQRRRLGECPGERELANLAAATQAAIVDVLVAKALRALRAGGQRTLVVAGGVGANRRLRERLDAACAVAGARVHYPELHLCTDNGAMIALAGALRLRAGSAAAQPEPSFDVRPRWPLDQV